MNYITATAELDSLLAAAHAVDAEASRARVELFDLDTMLLTAPPGVVASMRLHPRKAETARAYATATALFASKIENFKVRACALYLETGDARLISRYPLVNFAA
jgi:hypothetical protein